MMPSDVLSLDITEMDAERHTSQQVLRHIAKRGQVSPATGSGVLDLDVG